ncbi:hypothetical protein EI999_00855, partial [Streptococcus suis]
WDFFLYSKKLHNFHGGFTHYRYYRAIKFASQAADSLHRPTVCARLEILLAIASHSCRVQQSEFK